MSSPAFNPIHPDLFVTQKFAYKPSGMFYKNLVTEVESQEYASCTFEMNNKIIKFRSAKITPTKMGQFVTFWKRIGSGPILPYDVADVFDLLVVSVRNTKNFGQFVFPKSILLKKGLLSENNNCGKRAMRVYSPWDITKSTQAKKTQTWQLQYFLEINEDKVDITNVQKLFR